MSLTDREIAALSAWNEFARGRGCFSASEVRPANIVAARVAAHQIRGGQVARVVWVVARVYLDKYGLPTGVASPRRRYDVLALVLPVYGAEGEPPRARPIWALCREHASLSSAHIDLAARAARVLVSTEPGLNTR